MSNITIYRERPQFFRPIPKDYIMEVFDEAFKRTNLKGYDDQVTIEVLCRVFREVSEWCTEHLRSGDFVYGFGTQLIKTESSSFGNTSLLAPTYRYGFWCTRLIWIQKELHHHCKGVPARIYHHLELADQK